MKEITIKAPNEVLKVNLGEDSFTIPLGSSLPVDEVLKLSQSKGADRLEFMKTFLESYIPKEIYVRLTVGEMTQIFNAWSEATKEASGVMPGES